jgi:hypothetical protein
MAFKLFVPVKKKQHKTGHSNSIGFSPNGKISIYRPIIEQYFQEKQYAHLYYDEEEKLIGIKPAEKEDESTLKLSGDKSKFLSAKKFIKEYQINISEPQKFNFKYQDDMLVLKIS